MLTLVNKIQDTYNAIVRRGMEMSALIDKYMDREFHVLNRLCIANCLTPLASMVTPKVLKDIWQDTLMEVRSMTARADCSPAP